MPKKTVASSMAARVVTAATLSQAPAETAEGVATTTQVAEVATGGVVATVQQGEGEVAVMAVLEPLVGAEEVRGDVAPLVTEAVDGMAPPRNKYKIRSKTWSGQKQSTPCSDCFSLLLLSQRIVGGAISLQHLTVRKILIVRAAPKMVRMEQRQIQKGSLARTERMAEAARMAKMAAMGGRDTIGGAEGTAAMVATALQAKEVMGVVGETDET